MLGRGHAWLDTGTVNNNLSCSNFVQVVEERQNYKIACIEEIAFNKKWISKKKLNKIINKIGKCEYSTYLKKVIDNSKSPTSKAPLPPLVLYTASEKVTAKVELFAANDIDVMIGKMSSFNVAVLLL